MNPQDRGGLGRLLYLSQRKYAPESDGGEKVRKMAINLKETSKKGKNYGLKHPRFPRPPPLTTDQGREDSRPAKTRFSRAPKTRQNWALLPGPSRPATAGSKYGQFDSARRAESFNIHISGPEEPRWPALAVPVAGQTCQSSRLRSPEALR